MKITITGHTSGIGKALYEHLQKNHEVVGFSRSNGYDISLHDSRERIITQSQDCDIFINNAYNNFDRSQYLLLEMMFNSWRGRSDRRIINISSRWTHADNIYSKTKLEQDQFCLRHVGALPKIINVKPGLTDTPRVKSIPGNRMSCNQLVDAIQHILDTESVFNITSITFGY